MNLCHLWITVGISFLLLLFVFSLSGFDNILHSYTLFSFEIFWIFSMSTGMASTWLRCQWIFATQLFTSETLTFRFSRISTQHDTVYLCLKKTPAFCHMNHTLNSTDYANKNLVDCDGSLQNQLSYRNLCYSPESQLWELPNWELVLFFPTLYNWQLFNQARTHCRIDGLS